MIDNQGMSSMASIDLHLGAGTRRNKIPPPPKISVRSLTVAKQDKSRECAHQFYATAGTGRDTGELGRNSQLCGAIPFAPCVRSMIVSANIVLEQECDVQIHLSARIVCKAEVLHVLYY